MSTGKTLTYTLLALLLAWGEGCNYARNHTISTPREGALSAVQGETGLVRVPNGSNPANDLLVVGYNDFQDTTTYFPMADVYAPNNGSRMGWAYSTNLGATWGATGILRHYQVADIDF